MIARFWHGEVPAAKAAAYHDYLNESGLKDYKKVTGNKGVFLLKKETGGVAHFYTLTFWEDMEAIREFAGPEPEKARYYPEDKNYLLAFEPFVQHFEVLESSGPVGSNPD
jgi:heme-degrading monooxygenase HmoA